MLALLEDIKSRVIDGEEHYFGVVAGRREESKGFDQNVSIKIIDGQQRLTTSVLIISAIRDLLIEKHKKNIDLIDDSFQIKTDFYNPGCDENSNLAFQTIKNGKFQAIKNVFKNDNYVRNYLIIYTFLENKSYDDLLLFWSVFSTKFIVGLISFDDEKNKISNKKEMEIFENLNTKGKNLEPYDLTKNYIFTLCSEKTLNESERAVPQLFNEKLISLLDDFFDKKNKKIECMNEFFVALIHYATGCEISKKDGGSSQYLKLLTLSINKLFLFNSKSELNFEEYQQFINDLQRYLKFL